MERLATNCAEDTGRKKKYGIFILQLEPLAYQRTEYGELLVMPAILTCTIWWPMFGNIDSPLLLLSAQCLNTEWIMKAVLCHICVSKHLVRFWYFADRSSQYIYLNINHLDALSTRARDGHL